MARRLSPKDGGRNFVLRLVGFVNGKKTIPGYINAKEPLKTGWVGEMEINTINDILENNPARKARLAVEANELRKQWDFKKEELRRCEAKWYLKVKAQQPSYTQQRILAERDNTDEVYQARLICIESESLYRKKITEFNYRDDEWVSCRKLAEIRLAEMKRLGS